MNLKEHFTNRYIDDSELVDIDLPLIKHIFKCHKMLITCAALVLFVWSSTCILFLFKNQYSSQTTVLLMDTAVPNVFSADRSENNFLKAFSRSSDPFQNQEELLKSDFLIKKVYQKLTSNKTVSSIKNVYALLGETLNAERLRGTDFIKLKVTWHNPQEAQKIAEAYLQVYREVVDDISSNPIIAQRKLLQTQVDKAEEELQEVINEIQTYQENNGIVDIDEESLLLVTGIENLKNDYNETEASLSEKRGQIAKLQKDLNLETQTAIQAVANGQNSVYSGLISKLNNAEQEYDIKSLTYSPTNPDLIKLKETIAILNNQLDNQELLTIGRKLNLKEVVIMDDVRRKLVEQLALMEAQYEALRNKGAIRKEQIKNAIDRLQSMPIKQNNYSKLLFDKKNKEDVLARLKQNLTDAKIKESSLQSKLKVIDSPNLPQSPAFPNRFNLILLAAVVSFALPAGTIVGWKYVTQQTARPHFFEKICGIPILSIIPWLPEKQWLETQSESVLHGVIAKAYQTLVLNLKVQAENNNGQKAFALASIFTGKTKRSIALTQIALNLAKSGDTVVMIDANLQDPRLHKILGDDLTYDNGLTETINKLCEQISKNPETEPAKLLDAIKPSLLSTKLHPNLVYINAGIQMEDTFEFLNSKGFKTLIESLKSGYDWILVDSPALLKSVDTFVIMKNLNGLILLVERMATKQQVELAVKKVYQINAPIMGAVLRDFEENNSEIPEYYY